MPLRGPSRILASWLAVFAILVAGLVPALAQVVSAKSDANLVEICGAQGSKWVHLDGSLGDPPSIPSPQHLDKHCATCCLHAHAVALATAPAPLPESSLTHTRPFAPSPPLPLWQAWITAQPRAPPVLA